VITSGCYKWSFDPRTKEIQVWKVDGMARGAVPQHYDVTGDEGYRYCSQGRLIVAKRMRGRAAAAWAKVVQYVERPFENNEKVRGEARWALTNYLTEKGIRSVDWESEQG